MNETCYNEVNIFIKFHRIGIFCVSIDDLKHLIIPQKEARKISLDYVI